VLYQKKDKTAIQELYKILNATQFAAEHHKFLQQLWYNAHYLEEEMRINFKRKLGAVDKYRIRKRWPPPTSIWDGEPTKKGYRVRSREIMKQYYDSNKYPNLEDRRMLSEQCQLNLEQVKNWFKNRRKRESDKNVLVNQFYNAQILPKPLPSPIPISQRPSSLKRFENLPKIIKVGLPPSGGNLVKDDDIMTIESLDDLDDDEYIKPEPLDSDDEPIIDRIPLSITRK